MQFKTFLYIFCLETFVKKTLPFQLNQNFFLYLNWMEMEKIKVYFEKESFKGHKNGTMSCYVYSQNQLFFPLKCILMQLHLQVHVELHQLTHTREKVLYILFISCFVLFENFFLNNLRSALKEPKERKKEKVFGLKKLFHSFFAKCMDSIHHLRMGKEKDFHLNT